MAKTARRIGILIIGVCMMMGLSGCGKTEYKLTFDGTGFKSEKKTYAEGERVRVTYDMIGTDTDYTFSTDSDDVKLRQKFDDSHGYVFTFTMPDHDVEISVKSRNTMVADPFANPPEPDAAGSPEACITDENLVFEYYEATVATPAGDHSDRYCLYRFSDAQLVLAAFSESYDAEETMVYCLVPDSVLDDCMKLVKKYKMRKWKKGRGPKGRVYAVRFLDGDEMTRISSDHMPEDGSDAFDEICEVLEEAFGQYYSALETETWFCPECGTKNDRKYCSECGLEKPE